MPDYDNGKIYQLVFADRPERYVGSTTQELHQRLSGHRSTNASSKVKKLVDAVGRMNVRIILIEDYPCSNKNELLSREQYWIDKLKPDVNIKPAYIEDDIIDEKTKQEREKEIKQRQQEKEKEKEKNEKEYQIYLQKRMDTFNKFKQWRIDIQSPHESPTVAEKHRFRHRDGEYLNKWNDHGCHLLAGDFGEPCDIRFWCNNWDTCPYNKANQ